MWLLAKNVLMIIHGLLIQAHIIEIRQLVYFTTALRLQTHSLVKM